MKKLTPEIKLKVQEILKDLPKEKDCNDDEYFTTYELMIYVKKDTIHEYDFSDFDSFKGIRQLEKKINEIINQYGDTLYCVDFKYSYEMDEFDQFTIYNHNK
jgi:hypothetical protein